MLDRFKYTLIGLVYGGIVGAICWWLYGLAHSLNYHGVGMDPVLQHWLKCVGGALAAYGFLFKEQVSDLWTDAISAIIHFEFNDVPGHRLGNVVLLIFLAIVIAATWFSLRS